jgi:hypothetical protein
LDRPRAQAPTAPTRAPATTTSQQPAGSPGTAVATGYIQLTSTGNIGTIDRVTITWPQQGYSPLAMTKRIHFTVGATRDIQFHMPLTSDQITNLQNWQTGHNYADGCTYKATMTGMFGAVSGG